MGHVFAIAREDEQMAKFHFIEDYERHVANLIAAHPIDEAMSLAVGGSYELVGGIEHDLLRHLGLKDGMALMDLGCGSGRLAAALSRDFDLDYTGTDIVQSLLDYAAAKTRPTYRFLLNRELNLPVADQSQDFFTAFSVFTHLLHAETFIYLDEAKRVLKPGGKAVFSFIEFANPDHWETFRYTVEATRNNDQPHLNMFIERAAIECWARRLGFAAPEFIDAAAAPWGGHPLGQSIAILTK
jgi:ubiquinone/menaquinone biosynthesis C-methylase UbiE